MREIPMADVELSAPSPVVTYGLTATAALSPAGSCGSTTSPETQLNPKRPQKSITPHESSRNVVCFKTPKALALAVEKLGQAKATLPVDKVLVLAFLAGAYIALGGVLAIAVGGGMSPQFTEDYGPGLPKLLFGGTFPVGLMLVMIAGAELFTGNTATLAAPLLNGKITWQRVLQNWGLVWIGNLAGSLAVAYFLTYLTEIFEGEPYRSFVLGVAEKKMSVGWGAAVLKGIGCNWLVCLAVWLAIGAEDTIGKIWGVWFPVMAFVAIGFEHSVANMFFIPLGLMMGCEFDVGQMLWRNLIPVTLGNIIGGFAFVGAAYWYAFGRGGDPNAVSVANNR